MKLRIGKNVLIILGLGLLISCKTTKPVSNTNETVKEVHLYTSNDSMSLVKPEQKDIRSSIMKLEKVYQSKPHDVSLITTLAELHYLNGAMENAERMAKNALSHNLKNTRAKFVLAKVAYSRGQTSLAEMIMESMDEKTLWDSQSYNLMGLIALAKKDSTTAYHMFKKGLEKDPQDISIRMNLGALQLTYKQVQLAAIEFERVLKISPDHLDALTHLAIVKMALGDLPSAEKLLNKVLNFNSKSPVALYHYAHLLYKKGDMDNSAKNLEECIKLAGDDSRYLKPAYALAEQLRQSGAKGGLSNEEIQKLSTQLANQNQKPAPKKAAFVPPQASPDDKKPSETADSPASIVDENAPTAQSDSSVRKINVADEINELETIIEK